MRALILGLAVAAALLVGCGDDDDDTAAADRSDIGRRQSITFHQIEWRGQTYCFANYDNRGRAGGLTVIDCPPLRGPR